jgi:hypothetical protein
MYQSSTSQIVEEISQSTKEIKSESKKKKRFAGHKSAVDRIPRSAPISQPGNRPLQFISPSQQPKVSEFPTLQSKPEKGKVPSFLKLINFRLTEKNQ